MKHLSITISAENVKQLSHYYYIILLHSYRLCYFFILSNNSPISKMANNLLAIFLIIRGHKLNKIIEFKSLWMGGYNKYVM